MRLRGMLGQVQLARSVALRQGAAERGLRPLQTRPRHRALPTGAEERTLCRHVTVRRERSADGNVAFPCQEESSNAASPDNQPPPLAATPSADASSGLVKKREQKRIGNANKKGFSMFGMVV